MISSGSKSAPTPATSLRIQTSVQGKPIPIGWGQNRVAGNMIWYGDFLAIPQYNSQGSKGIGGGGGKGSPSSYNYSAAVMFGLGEGPIQNVLQVWNNQTNQSLSSLNFTWGDGDYAQAPWSYLSSHHSAQALNYRGIAWVGSGPLSLGSSQEMPNLTFEVLWQYGNAISGKPDADPKDILTDYLTNVEYGLLFPSQYIGDLSAYSSYCRAAGLVMSPLEDEQRAASAFINDLMTATNSQPVWSSGSLKVVPYGDTNLSANGATYTAPSAPLYSLGDDDFKPPQGSNPNSSATDTSQTDPVQTNIKRKSDAYNQVLVEFLDRASSYNPSIAQAKDDAEINLFGVRAASTKTLHMICDAGVATISAQLQLARQLIIRTFTFTVGQEYIMLDPMDIIEINDIPQGLINQWVRITEVTENQDGTLTITAEEYLDGTGSTPTFGTQANTGWSTNFNADPGDVNAPFVFGMPPALASNQGLTIGGAVSGSGQYWGGCTIYASTDNATYKPIGKLSGASRVGVTTADFPVGSDPDTIHTLNVDLTESLGELLSGTQSDADLEHTICAVGGANGIEFLSYEVATLTAANKYALGTYIRRGQENSTIVDHPAGSQFARVDGQIFQIPYTSDQIGSTLYLKFTSFNLWGGGEQSLDAVTAYPVTVPAPPIPPNVENFAVEQNGNVVAFAWDRVGNDVAIKGYDIGYAPQGTIDWSLFRMLTEASAGSEMTNAEVPPGSWTFGIKARDIADQVSKGITSADLTVTSANPIIYSTPENPNWDGTLNGFVLHYTGVLVPENQYTPQHYSDGTDNGYTDFDNFVNDPVATCTYTTNDYDTGIDDTLRIFDSESWALGPSQTGTPTDTLSIDTWLTGQTDPSTWTNWTIGYVKMRYFRQRITYNPVAGQVAFLTAFTPEVDRAAEIQQGNSQAVAAGGTPITFPNPFHFAPYINVTPIGNTALYGTASNITSTGCTLYLWNSSGTSVPGTANWSATGE